MISVAQLECVMKFKPPTSDHMNAQALITQWVVAGVVSPMSLTPLCKQGQCGVGSRRKNKNGEFFSVLHFAFGGWRHWCWRATIFELCMSSIWQRVRGRWYKALDTIPFPYPIIHHLHTVQYSPVQSCSDQISEQASNPWGRLPLTIVCCCS